MPGWRRRITAGLVLLAVGVPAGAAAQEGPATPGAPLDVAWTALGNRGEVSFRAPRSDGGSPITSYRATCRSTNGGTTKWAYGSSSPIVVYPLQVGSTYACTVAASNDVGRGPESLVSNTVRATTRPGAPQDVTWSALGYRGQLAFSPPASDGGAPITAYRAECRSIDGGNTKWVTGEATSSPILLPPLTRGATYGCVVWALNAVGRGPSSPVSNTVSATVVPGAPDAPSVSIDGRDVTVAFAPPADDGGRAVEGYRVACTSSDGGASQWRNGVTSPITLPLSAGATYTCTVAAVNAVGLGTASPPSEPVTAAGAAPVIP